VKRNSCATKTVIRRNLTEKKEIEMNEKLKREDTLHGFMCATF
jgi:hypothetical protein